jgi:hypothetical protein
MFGLTGDTAKEFCKTNIPYQTTLNMRFPESGELIESTPFGGDKDEWVSKLSNIEWTSHESVTPQSDACEEETQPVYLSNPYPDVVQVINSKIMASGVHKGVTIGNPGGSERIDALDTTANTMVDLKDIRFTRDPDKIHKDKYISLIDENGLIRCPFTNDKVYFKLKV